MGDLLASLATPFFAVLDFALDAPAAAAVLGSAAVIAVVIFVAVG